MNTISANDLKTKGTSAIELALKKQDEVIISVRGKQRFVVMDLEHYNYLRERELMAALHETQEDIKAGRFVKESVSKHFHKLKTSL